MGQVDLKAGQIVNLKKVSELSPTTTPSGTDVMPISSSTGDLKKITVDSLLGPVSGGIGNAAPSTSPSLGVNTYNVSGGAGTYTNFLTAAATPAVFSSGEISSNLWQLVKVQGATYWTKVAVPGFSLADNSILGSKIAPEAVTPPKTNFFKPGKNLFDKTTDVDGFFVDNTTGNLLPNATYSASDWIEVKPSTPYFFSGNGLNVFRLAWYTSAKVFISGSNVAFPQTSPSNAAFIRVSLFTANEDTAQLEEGTAATVYEPFKFRIDDTVIDDGIYRQTSDLIGEGDTSFFSKTRNLYDKNASIDGFFVNWGTGVLTPNVNLNASDWIPVSPSTAYFLSGTGGILYTAWYTSGKVFISGSQNTAYPITSPATAAFVRVSTDIDNKNSAQFEKGSSATAYVPFGYLPDFKINDAPLWNGREWTSLGDSITLQSMWQPYVINELGFILNNLGIGGTKVSGGTNAGNSFWSDVRVNAIPLSTKMLTIMGGMNDWAQDVAMGTIDSVDTDTFYGAYNVMMGKVVTRLPATRIILMTTTYGEIPDYIPRGWANPYTNTRNYTTRDYANAVREMGLKWGVPVIDVGGESGWNTVNLETFVTDDGTLIHPNALGGKRMAEVVIGRLNSINPISL